MNDLHKALLEIKRVLKPGGQVLFLEYGRAINRFLSDLQTIVNPLFCIFACGCNKNKNYFVELRKQGFIIKKGKISKCSNLAAFNTRFLYKGIAIIEEKTSY